jgi:hypothetical protein
VTSEVTINLPMATVDACITALSKFPYEQAAPHIDVLRASVNAVLTKPVSVTVTESEGGEA